MKDTYNYFLESTGRTPVIAAIKNEEWLEASLTSSAEIIYILYGTICDIPKIVSSVKEAGKMAIVHADLITGFSHKDVCVDFIKDSTAADGIISTKPNLIHRGNELNLLTIERFFMHDFLSYDNIKKYVAIDKPDIIEVMPAGLTKMIELLLQRIDRPLIASGLILDEADIIGALKAGAIGISTTNLALWDL